MQQEASLWTLFAASFLAATLLPGGSEAALFAVLRAHSELALPALGVATLGNTLGGMSSYLIGRIMPRIDRSSDSSASRWQARAVDFAQRHGAPVMLAAWVPFIGDPLCVAAGWLRLNWLAVAAFMLLGKLARYALIAWASL